MYTLQPQFVYTLVHKNNITITGLNNKINIILPDLNKLHLIFKFYNNLINSPNFNNIHCPNYHSLYESDMPTIFVVLLFSIKKLESESLASCTSPVVKPMPSSSKI